MNATERAAPELSVPGTDVQDAPFELARLEVWQDIVAVEPVWRDLEHLGAITTPYQKYDFLAAWQHHVGAGNGISPFIVTGYDPQDRPLFLWPLGISRHGPVKIAQFLGGTHANFNSFLWRRDAVAAITAGHVNDILGRLADGRHGVDVLKLINQPASWQEIGNPLALLPHQDSVNECTRLTLSGSGADVITTHLSSAMRSRLRNKERKLQSLSGYRYFRADSLEDVDRLLDGFFPLKAAHFAAQGLTDVFAEPGVADFFRQAARCTIKSEFPLIEIHALECDSEILAIFAAISDGDRMSLMFNTYTMSQNARHSPGLILLTHVVSQCADRGLKTFDLGVGEAGYKAFFCKEPEPLFDSFLPLSTLGRLAAPAIASTFAAKRAIKRNPKMMDAMQTMRKRFRAEQKAD